MKVNRLIRILKTFPQDMEVAVRGSSGTFWQREVNVRESSRLDAVALDSSAREKVNNIPYEEWLDGTE